MTPDEAMGIVYRKALGRARYTGQEPYLDEVLVGEIERLRYALAMAESERDKALGREIAELKREVPRPPPPPPPPANVWISEATQNPRSVREGDYA